MPSEHLVQGRQGSVLDVLVEKLSPSQAWQTVSCAEDPTKIISISLNEREREREIERERERERRRRRRIECVVYSSCFYISRVMRKATYCICKQQSVVNYTYIFDISKIQFPSELM